MRRIARLAHIFAICKHARIELLASVLLYLCVLDLREIVEEGHGVLRTILRASEDIASDAGRTDHSLLFVSKIDVDDLILACDVLKVTLMCLLLVFRAIIVV